MRSVDKNDTTDQNAGGNSAPLDTMGRSLWSLQSKTKTAGGAPTVNVYLQGSNDGVTWTTLITQNHVGAGSKFDQVANVAWAKVRVAWDTFNNLVLDEWWLHGQGSANAD